MDWPQLLSTKRVKGLYELESSTPIAGDLRSPFDRDYGRTIFSTPVRRLQDKAQVFPLERHDAIRTRLTHSMEDQGDCIARTRARPEGLIGTWAQAVLDRSEKSVTHQLAARR